MNKRSNTREYIIPAAVAGILFLIILAINGLWPFGRGTIDYYDMAQWADPFYYHNFDQLRGLKSFVYDWYSGLGREIPGLCEPSLFDVFLYLIPRNMILEFMSLLMMIKIMAAAFTMHLFIKDVNEDMPYLFRMMLGTGYGLCGFVIVNYTIPQWIDLAVFVPLVLMFAARSLKTGKITGLALSVFPIMILDYYFGIQTLLFVFLIGGAYCICLRFVYKQKEEIRKLHFTRLLAGIILGLGLSAFSWLPDMVFSFSSARFGNGMADESLFGMYISLLENIRPAYLSRWFALLGLSFASALVVTGMTGRIGKRRHATAVFAIACIFMTCSQLLLESIHLILHFGSYVDYPMRNAFMIYCIMAAFAAGVYDGPKEIITEKKPSWGTVAGGVVFTAFAVTAFEMWYRSGRTISDHTVLLVTMFMMAGAGVVHIILQTFAKGKYSYHSLWLWAAEIIIFGTIMIGKPLYDTPYGNDPEQEGEFIRITDQLVEEFGDDLLTGSAAATRRIKNPDSSLNANYGEVMRRETLAGWTNFATRGQIEGAISLGYSSQFTRLLDSGGNIFSDTILHITDIVSHDDIDEKLYEKIATVNVKIDHMTGERLDYSLYKNRFEMPFAMPVRCVPKGGGRIADPVELINEYAYALGSGEHIAEYVDTVPEVTEANGHRISRYSISTGHMTYYLAGECTDTDFYNTGITVNGKTVKIPSIMENDNELFPAHFNNNTVELGSFDDEDITVDIDMDLSEPEEEYTFRLYAIDRDALQRLCDGMPEGISVVQGKRSLDIEIPEDAADMTGMLIPVSYSPGWSAKVDGKDVQVTDVNGLFMFVPAVSGSKIHMSYFPPMMISGIIMAVMAAAVLFAFFIFDRKDQIVLQKADAIFGSIYMAVFAVIFAVIYVIPCLYAVLLILKGVPK